MVHAPPLIAIVDDDAPVRTALARVLRSTGYAVAGFACGVDFLADRDRLDPDCLVLDLHMPGMSGFEVQQRLAQMPRPLPVVVITGQDSTAARDRALAAGARAYLCKPVDKDELVRAIERAMNDQPTAGRT